MAGQEPELRSSSSPVTVRAVCIGLFFGVLINLGMLYNDYYLHNTPFMLNHLPTVGMAVLMALILVNTAKLGLTGRPGLSRGELLLVWGMVGVAGGIGATGFGRGVPGFAAGPAYFATAANEYGRYLLDILPNWMLVSKDPESRALVWYFEGLPRGRSVPWTEWLVPLLSWGAFGLGMYSVMLAMTSVFQNRWAREERLTFPIIYVPLEMTREPAPGRLVNDFFRNPVTWAGVLIPVAIYMINGLRNAFPSLPYFSMGIDLSNLFPDRPWSEFNLDWAGIYFPIVGLSFLLTTEVSFSIWFFYILFHLSFVLVAVVGAQGGGGFWGNWWMNVAVFETSGAMVAFATILCWMARKNIARWFQRALSRATDPEWDIFPPRLALYLLLGGMAVLVGWVRLAGASWWTAGAGILLFVCEILVLTRLVAEAGLLMIGTEANSDDFLMGIAPASWVGGKAAAVYVQLRGAFMCDMRETIMPYFMNGVQAVSASGVTREGAPPVSEAYRRASRVLAVFALTVIVSLFAAMYGRISTAYKYGATGGDIAYSYDKQYWNYGKAAKFQKNPPNYRYIIVGNTRIVPVTVAHTAVGAAVTWVLVFLRGRFLWWPLNPVGYLMCASWGIGWAWFSVFLGWLAKAVVMTFGGAAAYRRILPFFLGLILGHAVIATFWTVVSMVTGMPGVQMLPN